MSEGENRPIRRIVTGEAPDGTSVVASDTDVTAIETPLLPGALFYSLWGTDRGATLTNDGAEPPFRDWLGGFRFELIVLPPADEKPPETIDTAQALAETEKRLPGLIGKMDSHHPGMHQTDTVDLIYVTTGACLLQLESGAQVALKQGDVIVQGPRHAWHNPNAEPCGLLTVSIGVKRKG